MRRQRLRPRPTSSLLQCGFVQKRRRVSTVPRQPYRALTKPFDKTMTRPVAARFRLSTLRHFVRRQPETLIRRAFPAMKTLALRLSLLLICSFCAFASAAAAQSESAPPVTRPIVHSKFGGQIFGWDIDQNGTEGILAE